jgi:hypothetical protein
VSRDNDLLLRRRGRRRKRRIDLYLWEEEGVNRSLPKYIISDS